MNVMLGPWSTEIVGRVKGILDVGPRKRVGVSRHDYDEVGKCFVDDELGCE